jgi:hypothetical protein
VPRMPSDSFERFVALGPGRSYAKLAAALGTSKRSVVARASKEGWSGRLARIEAEARQQHDARAAEDLRAINERHLKMVRAVQGRAIEALRTMPMGNAVAAARALDVAVKLERVILGIARQDEEAAEDGRALAPSQADALMAAARGVADRRARGDGPPAASQPAAN